MLGDVISDRITGSQWRRQQKGQFVLANRITYLLFRAGLRPRIGQALKAKDGLVKVRGLLGVTHVKLNVISALQREKIFLSRGLFLWSSNGGWHANPSG